MEPLLRNRGNLPGGDFDSEIAIVAKGLTDAQKIEPTAAGQPSTVPRGCRFAAAKSHHTISR
jgi:hypothetical protein